MKNQTDTISSPKFLPWRELFKLPRIALYDERQRLWGVFLPEESAMLKCRTATEWYKLARKLLADQQGESRRAYTIPYEDEKVRGEFFLTPWSEKPSAPPQLTAEDIAAIEADLQHPEKFISFEELMDSVDRLLLEGDRETEGT